MNLIQPFKGLRPATGRADEVIAPPYDVLSTAEARQHAVGQPWSFLHISKPEIDLPEGTDPYSESVYSKAAENMARTLEQGILVRDSEPCYYIYRLVMGDHIQTGLVTTASVAAYNSNRIRKHEFTRPAKENDRVRQIDAVKAQTGPVLLAYPDNEEIDTILENITEEQPNIDVTPDDGVRHIVWRISESQTIDRLTRAFNTMPALYIADGHHRSAAAARVCHALSSKDSNSTGNESYNYFLSVIYPHHQMKILDYNRVVRDLNGYSAAELLARVAKNFDTVKSDSSVRPSKPTEFGMYLDGQWYRLNLKSTLIPTEDPVARLDVSLLATYLIEPLLGISDPRRDERIDFIGGIRGLQKLENRVDSGGMACAFSLFPTRMEDLMAVADANQVMPPKSTWFEPKLADGLVSHVLD